MNEWEKPPEKSSETWAAEAAMRQAMALERMAGTLSKLDPVLDELENTIKEEARQHLGRG